MIKKPFDLHKGGESHLIEHGDVDRYVEPPRAEITLRKHSEVIPPAERVEFVPPTQPERNHFNVRRVATRTTSPSSRQCSNPTNGPIRAAESPTSGMMIEESRAS